MRLASVWHASIMFLAVFLASVASSSAALHCILRFVVLLCFPVLLQDLLCWVALWCVVLQFLNVSWDTFFLGVLWWCALLYRVLLCFLIMCCDFILRDALQFLTYGCGASIPTGCAVIFLYRMCLFTHLTELLCFVICFRNVLKSYCQRLLCYFSVRVYVFWFIVYPLSVLCVRVLIWLCVGVSVCMGMHAFVWTYSTNMNLRAWKFIWGSICVNVYVFGWGLIPYLWVFDFVS